MDAEDFYKANDGTLRMATLHVAPGVVIPATPENISLVAAAHAEFQRQSATSPRAAQDWASYFADVVAEDVPLDGYESAISKRQGVQQPSASAKKPADIRVFSTNGIPDGYATALAKLRKEA